MNKLKISILYYFAAGILGLLLISFIFRSPLASWLVHRKIDQFNRVYGADLKINNIKILGLASIRVTGITLKPISGDTLMKIDTAYASFGILKLFAGRLAIHKVELKNTGFFILDNGLKNNYMFLFRKRRSQQDTVKIAGSYAHTAGQLFNFAFDKIPLALSVRNFNILHKTPAHEVGFHLGQLNIDQHFFRSVIEIHEDTVRQAWMLSGRIENSGRLAEFRLFPANGRKMVIPYLREKWNAGVSLDTLAFRFSELESDNEVVKLGGFATLRGLVIDHEKIARQPVLFDKLAFDYQFNLGADYAEIDSATRVTFNRIDFHPYLKYQHKPVKQITLSIHKPPFPAQELFSSFPEGLFSTLDGIKVRGNLSWFLDFYLDLSVPDSLKFETSLNRHQFSVLNYGEANLSKLNESFSYTAYEHDQPVRTFIVGPENPDFRRLDQMSPFLQYAAMTAEDGAFYQHRGFLPDAFRESMILNIKERRFARGGSTISMQLVKNVFLNRNKTIARKMEEALIVWLIENMGLSSKERMMEVYLNVIEWGPLIYGANEAARFYFNKDVSRITLAEAIFMASIIPRPKWFKYNFDEYGHLKESNRDFYRVVSEKMLNKGWISPADLEKLVPDVELKGPARLFLKNND